VYALQAEPPSIAVAVTTAGALLVVAFVIGLVGDAVARRLSNPVSKYRLLYGLVVLPFALLAYVVLRSMGFGPALVGSALATDASLVGGLVADFVELLAAGLVGLAAYGPTVRGVREARDIDLSGLGVDALDAALVDVPCSCEGTVRKNPTTLDDWHESYLDRVSGTQKGILRRAVQLTRSGGRVAYATCTFAPEENEAVLDHVLAREDCRLVDVDLPLDSVPGVTVWRDEEYDPSVAHAHRVYPHHNDTGGFFVALLEVGA